nr:unnamed protein product [Callosobruchus chinensis]
MLDDAGNLLEKLIRARLRTAIVEAGGLSDNQHGFRPGHSTIGAIQEVVNYTNTAWAGNHRIRDSCILVTLDVKNAFNSARWNDILAALQNHFSVTSYLLRIITDYLDDRELVYQTTEGLQRKKVSAGVAQGSVLGPDLWNIMYDGILRMEIPEWAMLIGYADDIAAVIRARDPAEAKGRVELVVSPIHDWLKAHGLQLAISKTEIVVLTRQRRFPEPLWVSLNDTTLEAKCAVKYLGEIIDAKLTHFKQICAAAHKAAKMVASLSRLMPNIAGSKPSKRRTLMSVAHSIMLYGAEIWADALMVQKYRKCLSSVQRTAALRVACAYRTVSEIAVLVVAVIPPIDMLAIERKMLYHKRKRGKVISSTQVRSITLEKWQERWEQERDVGKWTHILIPRIEPWYTRKHGEISYYLSQFLTGHGLFNAYLYRIGKRNSAMCSYCSSEDDPRHTFFECERWESKGQLLQLSLGIILTPENLMPEIFKSEECWAQVATYVEEVLREKKMDQVISIT